MSNFIYDSEIKDISSNLIILENRHSISKLTEFEKASIIGLRAEMIANGSKCKLEEIPESILIFPMEIAKMEFEKGLLVIDVHRPVQHYSTIKYELIRIGRGIADVTIINTF